MKVSEAAAAYDARIPAAPELIARAADLVRRHPECFWFWRPDARIENENDVRMVVRHLRDYGDKRAWAEAQDLRKCL